VPGYTLAGSFLYWIGTICGMVGVFAVVGQTFAMSHNVQIFTGVLIALAGASLIGCAILSQCLFDFLSYAILALATFLDIVVFYSDWVLTAVVDNL
jgi:hypothetical protein